MLLGRVHPTGSMICLTTIQLMTVGKQARVAMASSIMVCTLKVCL